MKRKAKVGGTQIKRERGGKRQSCQGGGEKIPAVSVGTVGQSGLFHEATKQGSSRKVTPVSSKDKSTNETIKIDHQNIHSDDILITDVTTLSNISSDGRINFDEDEEDDYETFSETRQTKQSRRRYMNQRNRQAGRPYEGSMKGADGKRVYVLKDAKKAGPICNFEIHPPWLECKEFTDIDLNSILSDIIKKYPSRVKQIEFVWWSVQVGEQKLRRSDRTYFLQHPKTKKNHRVCCKLFASCIGQSVQTLRRWTNPETVATPLDISQSTLVTMEIEDDEERKNSPENWKGEVLPFNADEQYVVESSCDAEELINIAPEEEEGSSSTVIDIDKSTVAEIISDADGESNDALTALFSEKKKCKQSRRKTINQFKRQTGRPYEGSTIGADGKRVRVMKEGKKAAMCSFHSHPPQFECKEFANADLDAILSEVMSKCPSRAKQIEYVQSLIKVEEGINGTELRFYFLEHPETKNKHRVCSELFASCVGQSVRTIRRWGLPGYTTKNESQFVLLGPDALLPPRSDTKSLDEFFSNLPKIESEYAKRAHNKQKAQKKAGKLDYWIKSKKQLHQIYTDFCKEHGYVQLEVKSGRPEVKELAIKNLAVNLSYFINKPGIKQQLAILGPDLRQEILDELSKLSCSAERNTGDSKMMDLLINILPHLLSSETKEFQTKWILTFCSPEQRNPYRNFILNIVADCAPNLCFLIVEGEMFPEEIKMPTVDAITRMKCLTRLSAECLRVKIKFDNIITATVNKKELRENLRCLKDFRFSILPSLQIWDASSSAMLPIYSSLLFGKICAETLPNLEVMKLISKNSDKNLFLFEETQFEFQSSLRHLAVCLYDRYANNQLEQFWMLPEVTNLTVNFTNFTTNSLEESSPMFQLTKVTDLRLEGIDSEEILLCFLRKFGGNLRTLYVEVSSILVDELRLSFAQISKLCPKLEKLELKGHIDMIDSSEHFLPFENLQELQWEVSKENAIASILQSPNLKKDVGLCDL
ncbi:Hypothetical predicted protein [Cloeon dipterum]|uniref:Uncharacterized protein n=1 Tax=Cloeon dipterum TaxID=197152 RepID=A0A8S1CVI5_9INSE|nr:Hypothetical predicted protein [Cloeon dipterum]